MIKISEHDRVEFALRDAGFDLDRAAQIADLVKANNNVEIADGPCKDADGCPTETAVLKRFWRAHNGTDSDYELINKVERANLEENARVCNDLQYGNVWYWQGDGYDFPESLVCPVFMSADTLRDLLSKIPSIDSQ